MEEKVFRLKKGFCHVFPDKIIISLNGVADPAKTKRSNNIAFILLIYLGISSWFIYRAYQDFTHGFHILALFPAGLALLFLVGIFRSLNNTTATIIDRDQIIKVKLRKGIKGITKSYFEIFFKDDKGKVKRRMLLLPGTLEKGSEATEKAIRIMTDENLLEKFEL